MCRPFLRLLWLVLPLVAAAWQDEPATVAEFGFASQATWRGLALAREGGHAALTVQADKWDLAAAAHAAWRQGGTRVGSLQGAYRLGVDNAAGTLALTAGHVRLAGGGVSAWRHTTEIGAALGLPAWRGMKPRLAYSRDLRREGDTVELALTREVALLRWGAFLEWELGAGWTRARQLHPDAPGGGPREDGHAYWRGSARVPYRVGERLTLVIETGFGGTHGAAPEWTPLRGAGRAYASGGLSVRVDF